MKKHLILAVALISLCPIQVFAGGSVSYQDDVKPLVEKQPALKQLYQVVKQTGRLPR